MTEPSFHRSPRSETATFRCRRQEIRRSPIVVASLLSFVFISAAAAAAAGTERPKVMFTSSARGSGDLSTWPDAGGATGLAAADAICRARASVAGLANPQGFVAWMSDAHDDAYCRVLGLSGKKSSNCGQDPLPIPPGGWVRTDGHPFVSSFQKIFEGAVYVPPRLDELGDPVFRDTAWTGTFALGHASSDHCSDWSSSQADDTGLAGYTDAAWLEWVDELNGYCSGDRHLLCFETGSGPDVEISRQEGAVVFYSGSRQDDGAAVGGLMTADGYCEQFAAEAGLPRPESYRAWSPTLRPTLQTASSTRGRGYVRMV